MRRFILGAVILFALSACAKEDIGSWHMHGDTLLVQTITIDSDGVVHVHVSGACSRSTDTAYDHIYLKYDTLPEWARVGAKVELGRVP